MADARYSPSGEGDIEKFNAADPQKAKQEHLEVFGGKLNGVEPFNRPEHFVDIDPTAEARLRRKLDFCLVPTCILLYLLNYIDRAAIGNARVAGLEKDLHLKGNDFYIALTIFYIVYILVEVPSNIMFKKTGSWWLAFLVIGFGVTTIGTAFTHSFGGLIATRVFLGATEGGLLPGIAYLLSRYYRRQELIFRIGVFLALSPCLSGAFGGLLATAFLKAKDHGQIESWRKIFFYEGVITTAVGILAFFFLPDWPEKSRLLNEEERRIAIARIENENVHTTDPDDGHYWTAFKKAFTVHSTLCIVGYSCINVSVQGLSTFMPTIIRALGKYSAIQIQLRTVPPYVVAAVWSCTISYIAWKVQKRGIMIMISVPIAILGYGLFLGTTNPHARYAGCFLCFTGVVPLGPFFLSWGLNNMPLPTSRAILSALIPGLGTVGSVVSTWTYTANFAPNYRPGNSINAGTTSTVFLIGLFLTWYVRHENAIRERGDRDHLIEGLSDHEQAKLGHRHPAYRYVE